jgi:hypothetical protein
MVMPDKFSAMNSRPLFIKLVTGTGPLFTVVLILTIALTNVAVAQVNGQGQSPYLGWSSWSQEALHGEGWATEGEIETQSDNLKSSGLQSHGYVYLNIDSGWQGGFDGNGRPTVDPSKFPDGIAATIQHIHNNGQKAGIYWIPGVQQPVWDSNSPILGSPYTIQDIVLPDIPGNAFSYGQSDPWHKKIDFTRPGAQAYINSVVNLFASWGVDLIKLDGVTPGSDHNNLNIDNRPDVIAWSQAIAQAGRPMWLTISWALDHDYLSTWQTYSNARRIDDDVDCYCGTLTTWTSVSRRFSSLVTWQRDSGPTLGWNDLDSLEVGDGSQDGLTNDERQSATSLWVIANAPIYLGDDLTNLDSFGLQLLTNDKVIAVDQSGVPGIQISSGNNPVWASSKLNDGTYNIALFNLNSTSSATSVNWSSLGFSGSADVFDLWANEDLGSFSESYTAVLNAHASQLLKVTLNSAPVVTPTISLNSSATNAYSGDSITLAAQVSSASGTPSGTVSFLNGTTALGSTVLAGGNATLTTSALPVGLDTVTASYTGDANFSATTSAPLNITVNPGFGISASPTALALTSTKMQTTSILTVIPGGDTRTLTFACSSLPAVYSCSFSPAGLPLSGLSAQQQVTMTVSSLSALLGAGRYSSRQKASMALSRMGLNILTSFVLWLFVPVERRQLRRLLIALITLFLAVGLIACSTSSITDSSGPPPSSSYSFQVNVIAGGNTVRSLSYTLTVQ